MKPVVKSAGYFGKQWALMLAACLLALPWAVVAQPTGTYISPASVTTPPQVNATNFINAGTWAISTPRLSPIPFWTSSTYNYTNTGTMACSIGWQFDHGPWPSGARDWSANFFNDNFNPNTDSGLIDAVDGPTKSGQYTYLTSYLLISATNIVNQGILAAGANGLMVLNGSGVNLSRSGLEISPIQGIGSINPPGATNFTPDVAIYDEYWGGGTNSHAFIGSPWSGFSINQDTFNQIGEYCGLSNQIVSVGPLVPQVYAGFTNAYGPSLLITTNADLTTFTNHLVFSNIVQQAIFVYVGDPNIIPSVKFGQSLSISNIYRPMAAQLLTYSTNLATGSIQASTIYVEDNLAAVYTNGILLIDTNLNPGATCSFPTYRPDSAVVSRSDQPPFSAGYYVNGVSGNYPNVLPSTFFYDPATFSNAVPVGRADAYSALVDNIAAQPVGGSDITNAPGKIQIYAKDLNLFKARITAATEILVQASNLVNSAGALMDCQNLSYNLGSTNGSLNITNLAATSVQRLHGTVNEWSGLWTNYMVLVFQNFVTNSTDGGSMEADITNVTEMDLAITVVDAGNLRTVLPVTVQNLVVQATNAIVSDTMNVGNVLQFNGTSLTINGGINLTGFIEDWSSTTAPILRYFTNNGSLSIPNDAHFGDDGKTNYAAFVNTGTITAGAEYINSDYFQGGGSQSATVGFQVATTSGKVENGSINVNQDVQFTAGTLKLNHATISSTAGPLIFEVTGSLFDAGGSSGNVLTCNNGFALNQGLMVKPLTGDLLGTKLETIAPVFNSVQHFWPGLDLGAAPAGYNNNEAVGTLALDEGFDSAFQFSATSVSNAIYVDVLDLSQCPDYLDPEVVSIDPNFVIYYAAVKGVVVPPANSPQEPEEYLNGKLGGHLVWVSGFAGPNSSEYCLVNGKSILVNSALRHSKIIDSNGNGIANEFEQYPFDTPPVVVSGSVVTNNPPPAKQFAISWTAAANTVYQVQYSTNLAPASWLPLQNYTNNSPSSVFVTVWDTNVISGQRYYRVSHP